MTSTKCLGRLFSAALAGMLVLVSPAASHACHCAIWSVSKSSSTPFENQGTPTGGTINLFLWLYTANAGAATAEVGFEGTIVPQQFIPESGFQNSGTPLHLQLTMDLCLFLDPVLIGTLVCQEPMDGGELCLAHPEGSRLDVIPCPEDDHPAVVGWVGYSSSKGSLCKGGYGYSTCGVDAVEPSSWGGIKAGYREPHP